jgi:hypothetical protein
MSARKNVAFGSTKSSLILNFVDSLHSCFSWNWNDRSISFFFLGYSFTLQRFISF